jgi:hypothetical protein
VDFEAVYDELSGDVLVQFPGDTGTIPQPDIGDRTWQVRSSDLGASWATPTLLGAAVLGPYDGLLVGPGRGLQLRSSAKGKRGRLLFCGHTDTQPGSPTPSAGGDGRVAPVWVSDDSGKSFRMTSILPFNATGGTASCKGQPDGCPGGYQWGPDEGQMVELSNGDIRLEARNNFAVQTGHKARMVTISHDGGDSFGPIFFDDNLDNAMDTQASIISDPRTGDIYVAGPVRVHCTGPSCNVSSIAYIYGLLTHCGAVS